MNIEIQLEKMTTLDNLKAMEKIWDDLQRTPDEVPSPEWHAEVLEARQERVKEGTSKFSDLTTVKKYIRSKAE